MNLHFKHNIWPLDVSAINTEMRFLQDCYIPLTSVTIPYGRKWIQNLWYLLLLSVVKS